MTWVPYFLLFLKNLCQILEGRLQSGNLLLRQSHTLTHLLMIRRPGAEIVLGSPFIPGYEVELLGPAVLLRWNAGDCLNDFKIRCVHLYLSHNSFLIKIPVHNSRRSHIVCIQRQVYFLLCRNPWYGSYLNYFKEYCHQLSQYVWPVMSDQSHIYLGCLSRTNHRIFGG